MIEGRTEDDAPQTNAPTENTMAGKVIVEEITPEMILADLDEGRTRVDIQNRYMYKDATGTHPLEKWMVEDMFKDPALKGKKPSKRRALPFTFKRTPVAVVPTPAPVSTSAEETLHGISDTEGGHQMGVDPVDDLPTDPAAATVPDADPIIEIPTSNN